MKVHGNLIVTGTTEGITFTDGSTTFERQPKLTFGASDFYLGSDGTGRPKVQLKNPGVQVSANINAEPNSRLSFADTNFYLSQGSGGQPVVNFKLTDIDAIQLFAEAPAVGNYFVENEAPYDYTVNSVALQLQSGTATVGFYLLDPGSNKNGRGIASLDPISVTSTKQTITPSQAVSAGQQIKMSITAASSAKQLRVALKATRS